MEEDIRGKVQLITLVDRSKESFRNSLCRKLILDQADVDRDLQVENWLRAEQTLVLYAPIKAEKESAIIIQGAIEYLKRLSIHNVRVAVLFSSKKRPKKLPDGCDDMKVLRALQADDIEDWLDEGYASEKIGLTSKKALKQKLSSLLTNSESSYREALEVLEEHELQC